jgi:hypothetical protein
MARLGCSVNFFMTATGRATYQTITCSAAFVFTYSNARVHLLHSLTAAHSVRQCVYDSLGVT